MQRLSERLIMNTSKLKFGLTALTGALLLVGCDLRVNNMTPETVPENPSGYYDIVVSIEPASNKVIADSIEPFIVIDGQTFPMEASARGPHIFEYEYRLPPNRSEARYYFQIDYELDKNQVSTRRQEITDLQEFRLTDRYALSLDVERAPAGSRVGVVGRGFSQNDRILVGEEEAETVFHSSNSLEFFVPSLPYGREYPVRLVDDEGSMNAGTLRIDPGTIRVEPERISFTTGDRTTLVFTIPTEAPPGGLYIDVMTDVPESIIMPEIIIPGGSRSVNVSVEGGRAGQGSLFIQKPGYEELRIPISVSGR